MSSSQFSRLDDQQLRELAEELNLPIEEDDETEYIRTKLELLNLEG